MALHRNWVTPFTAGTFLLSAVTGVLIFFHLDMGLNKLAHEWLSWALLGGVALHLVINWTGFKRYFSMPSALGILALSVLVLGLSFLPLGDKKGGESPFMSSVRALSQTSLSNLALVAGKTPEEVRGLLMAEGLQPVADTQSVAELVGSDGRRQMQVLNKVFAPGKQGH